MMTSSHITAAEVRHQQKSKGRRERYSVREIKRQREREGKKPNQQTGGKRARNFFHDEIRVRNFVS